MDIKQTDLYWFQLNKEIRVEDVDKFSGNNMHPDRMMTQWVLVLMISGERSFRVYGENYVVHSGEFFLLPPYVQHCGLQYDNHAAYFAHFQATGIQVPPPVKVDTNHILLPRNNSSPLCKAGRQTKEEYGFKRGLNQWSVVLLFAFCYCKDEFNTDGALHYVATQPMGK